MKKLVFAALTAMTVVFGGCSKKSEGDLLSSIKAKGKITIAMEGAWAPWTYHDEKNELVGYDVEVGNKKVICFEHIIIITGEFNCPHGSTRLSVIYNLGKDICPVRFQCNACEMLVL